MAVTIKLKNASGSDPSASDLVVGEVAIRTDNGKLFTKKDNGSVAEITGGGGIDDGDKGDITVSNSGDTFTIDNEAVTTAKMQHIAQNTVLGRTASGTGDVETLNASDLRGLINVENGSTGDQTGTEIRALLAATSNTNILNDTLLAKLNGIAAQATNVTNNNQLTNGAGYLTQVDTSDITNNAVSLDKLVDIAQNRVIGRVASGTGDATTLTAANIRTMINVEDGATGDQTANEILTLLKTVDGSGSGLDADTLDGISIASLVRSDTADTISAPLVINGGTSNATDDATLYVTATNNNDWGLKVDKYNGSATEFGQVIEVGSSATYALQVTGNGSEVFRIQGNGNVVLSGTVDGRDLASDGSKLDGIASGATNVSTENIQDIVGGMVSGNSESGITVTYQDGDGTLDFSVASQTDQNFTTTLKNKLDGIAAGATNVTNNNQLTNGAGYITSAPTPTGAAKKFVNFNGTNNSIRNDLGVSSISDHGAGQYTINFDGNFANTNYTITQGIYRGSGGILYHFDIDNTITTSSHRIMISRGNNVGNMGLVAQDTDQIHVAFHLN